MNSLEACVGCENIAFCKNHDKLLAFIDESVKVVQDKYDKANIDDFVASVTFGVECKHFRDKDGNGIQAEEVK